MMQSIAKVRDFFIADTHFGHTNVIKYCARPFKDVIEMEKHFVSEWNAGVNPQDRVFILGDFSFYDEYETQNLLKRLRGQKFLVKGNHDSMRMLKKTHGFHKIVFYEEQNFELDNGDVIRVCLSHFPLLSWHQMHRGAYHFHGHCHGGLMLPEKLQNARIFDVGVDNTSKIWGHWGPVTLEDVVTHLREKSPSSVDFHSVKKSVNMPMIL